MTDPASRRPYPSVPAVVFTLWAVVVPVVFSHGLLNSDGDLLRHLRHGTWMLTHRALLHMDEFSYTKAGEPFVAFEYGSQLLYALVYRAGGLAGVSVFAGLLIAASSALVASWLIRRGAHPLLTYLVTLAAAVLGSVHWLARPHLLTLLAVSLLLLYLEPGERRPPLWRLALLFAVWANLQGGFVFGLVLLATYLAGSLAEWRWGTDPERWRERTRYYAAALVVAGLATLATPNGLALHLHVLTFFGEPFLRNNTQEFLSPDFHSADGQLLLAALLALFALFALVPGRPSYPRLLLTLVNVAFALQAQRNIQLLAVTVLPVLALHFDAAFRRLPDRSGRRAAFERDARRGTTAVVVGVVGVVMLGLAAAHGRLGPLQAVPDRLDPAIFPIAAVQRARAERLQGRIFHDFIWGGYLLHAWPEQKVFIDGGTDFYGPRLMRTFIDVTRLQPGWREKLAAWNVAWVLMRPRSPLVNELAQDGGWRVWYCDHTAALLGRDATAQPAAVMSHLDRCTAGRREAPGAPVGSSSGPGAPRRRDLRERVTPSASR